MRSLRLPALVALVSLMASTSSWSSELPADDVGLFAHMFSQKPVPAEWIYQPASEELTPLMLEQIARRLGTNGGAYHQASKTARGWLLEFDNGTARARIVRAGDKRLIGVFFSELE